MRNQHHVHTERPFRQFAATALTLVLTVLLGSALISISWNHFAPEIFGLTEIGMRASVAVVLFVFTIGSILRLTFTRQWNRHRSRQQQG